MMTTTGPQSGARRQRRTRGIALVVVGAVLMAIAGVTGFLLGSADPSPVETTVVRRSSDGDSVCVDPAVDGHTCGQPVISPSDRDRVLPGAEVLVNEVWAEQDGGKRLLFVIDVPD